MTVGLPPDKAQIDAWSGALCRDMRVFVRRVNELSTFLVATPDADLQAAPFGYTQGDVGNLKGAIAYLKTVTDAYSAGGNRVFVEVLAGLGPF